MSDEIASVGVAYGRDWSSEIMRSCYESTIAMIEGIGLRPDRLSANAPGIGKGYASYTGRKRYFTGRAFKGMKSFEIVSLGGGGTNEFYDWSVNVHVNKSKKTIFICWMPSMVGIHICQIYEHYHYLMSLTAASYGYVFRQAQSGFPVCYAMGLIAGDVRRPNTIATDDTLNKSQWRWNRITQAGGTILRDVFPDNLLGIPHQQAPVGRSGQTLQEWIEQNPDSRGTLDPVADGLSSWKPPVENIPLIREVLYRAGRVYYWKFMKPQYFDPAGTGELLDEPLYRPDLSSPWEAEGPTPEIFTAEFYKDKDPGLIY